MYIRTPHALVWVESPSEPVQADVKPQAKAHTPYQERWALKPLNITRGRCVAVRQSTGKLEVGCMVDNRLIWVTVPHATLPEKQLQRWLKTGF